MCTSQKERYPTHQPAWKRTSQPPTATLPTTSPNRRKRPPPFLPVPRGARQGSAPPHPTRIYKPPDIPLSLPLPPPSLRSSSPIPRSQLHAGPYSPPNPHHHPALPPSHVQNLPAIPHHIIAALPCRPLPCRPRDDDEARGTLPAESFFVSHHTRTRTHTTLT